MNEDRIHKDDVMRFFEQYGNDQVSLKDFMTMFIMSPFRTCTTRIVLSDGSKKKVLSETKEGIVVNAQGSIEEIKETIHTTLDDGTSLNGIAVCQSCRGTVKEENLRRCVCGKTCCIRPDCGIYVAGKWYCSRWHSFLGPLGML